MASGYGFHDFQCWRGRRGLAFPFAAVRPKWRNRSGSGSHRPDRGCEQRYRSQTRPGRKSRRAQARAEGIAEIEGADVQRRGEVRGLTGRRDHHGLRDRADCEGEYAPQRDDHRCDPGRSPETGEGGQHKGDSDQYRNKAWPCPPIRHPCAEIITGRQTNPDGQQNETDICFGDAGVARQDRRHVGEEGEHAGGGERADRQRQPDRRRLQRMDFGTQIACGFDGRKETNQAEQRDCADAGDDEKGRTPACGLTDEGAERHADDIGDGQSADHEGNRPSAAVGRREARGRYRAGAEESGVTQGGDDPRRHQQAVGGRKGAAEIAGDKTAPSIRPASPAPGRETTAWQAADRQRRRRVRNRRQEGPPPADRHAGRPRHRAAAP